MSEGSFTCMSCLQGRHVRCEDRVDCACTTCRARRSKPRATPTSRGKLKGNAGLPRELEETAKKLPRKRAKQPRKPESEITPKAVYMRDYRKRLAEGGEVKKYRKWTPEVVAEMAALRDQGVSVREIGRRFGVDQSYVRRLIEKHGANAGT